MSRANKKNLFFINGLWYSISATQSNIANSFKGIHFGKKCILSFTYTLERYEIVWQQWENTFLGASLVGAAPFLLRQNLSD